MAIVVISLVNKGLLIKGGERACEIDKCKWYPCKSHINQMLFFNSSPQIIEWGLKEKLKPFFLNW